jgi:transposase
VPKRRRRRSYTCDFKLCALKRMTKTDNIQTLAAELGVERALLYKWRAAFAVGGDAGLRRAGRPSAADRAEAALAVHQGTPPSDPARRIAELQRKIGEQQLALDFFREALRHVREQRRKRGVPGGKASTS